MEKNSYFNRASWVFARPTLPGTRKNLQVCRGHSGFAAKVIWSGEQGEGRTGMGFPRRERQERTGRVSGDMITAIKNAGVIRVTTNFRTRRMIL